MRLYGIGGLGVDKRVFSELRLDRELIPLDWIAPLKNETLESYASRFAEQIDVSEPCCIIGISFGGMLALEISKTLPIQKVILISSATGPSDIPWIFRVVGRVGLMKYLPALLMKPPSFVANWSFGVTDPRYRRILKSVIADTDLSFLRWATTAIAHWRNQDIPTHVIRIHGGKDRLLACPKKESVTVIPGAGHFMVMDRAEEVSQAINEALK